MTPRILERAAGRPVGPPSRDSLRDGVRRAVHAARHTRFASGADHGDVFSIDMHVAVVADARDQLERLGISLVDWTLSGHSWTTGRSPDPVAIVNERTWFSFSPRMARRFRRVYRAHLESFRGFLAAYPPCFALLYEGLGRPTLTIAATRYEWPFTSFGQSWEWLDDGLRAGVRDGWLTLAANNRADAGYLENYTGLDARHIPSACTYTDVMYTGRRSTSVVCASDRFAELVGRELAQSVVPLRGGLGERHSRADLYDHRALVLIPYNVSLMALSEHYTACAPIYVPARDFLEQLMAQHPQDVLSELSFTQVTGLPAAERSAPIDLNDVSDPQVVDWYLDRADFYDTEWMPHIRQFESWAHLDHLLAHDDPHEISAEMAAARPERLRRIAALWDNLPWTQAVAD